MSALLDDPDAEHRALDELLAPLDAAGWEAPTPAEGWAVRDQVGHLAWFDRAARLAVAEPQALAAEPEGIGAVAAHWMAIAQAFAGPPGAGRQPGQFQPRHRSVT